MQQYVIIARDGGDTKALERRMTARPFHFEMAKKLKADNHFVLGGALLNEAGTMEGSVMVVQFDSEDEMKSWLENEPYIKGDVWQQIEVKKFKVADV